VSDDEVMVRTLLGDWANRGWGMWGPGMAYGPKMVDDLVRLVRAEREACVKIIRAAYYCDEVDTIHDADRVVAAIRARADP
jgi:hypothetical protein